MTVKEIITILNADIHTGHEFTDKTISAACGSDLMSDVIAFVKDEIALLTGLNTIQAVRTAIIMDIIVLIIVRGKRPTKEMIALSKENGIIVLSTNHPLFLACGKLYAAGLTRGGTREIGTTPELRNAHGLQCSGDNFARAGDASAEVKRKLKLIGVRPDNIRRTIIALYEAEINMIIHAGGGKIAVTIEPEYISIKFIDQGPGIPDIDLAMSEGYSTASEDARRRGFGSGMGFSNMKKNTDHLTVESKIGLGTTLDMRVNF